MPLLLRLVVASSLAVLSFTRVLAAQSSPVSLEFEIKASFLLNFPKYVEGEQTQRTESEETFMICIAGSNPFGDLLRDISRQTIDNKRASTRILPVLNEASEVRDCGLIYYTRGAPVREEALGKIASLPIITVSEKDIPAVISFYLKEGKVRFAISRRAARAAGLEVSSHLLRLAEVVD